MIDRLATHSLESDLSARNQQEFETLFQGRPDLLDAPCRNVKTLAARCTSVYSLLPALDGLDSAHLGALFAAVVCAPPVGTDAISAALGRDSQDLVHGLWELALLYGNRSDWSLPSALRALLLDQQRGPTVGLLYPRIARYAAEPAILDELLATAPQEALRIIGDLLRTSVVVQFPAGVQRTSRDPAQLAIHWLMEHQILVPVGSERVAMPAEIVALMRTEYWPSRRVVQLDPPRCGRFLEQRAVDEVGAQAAMAAVDSVAAIGQTWSAQPPSTVANGGLAVRDLNRTATALGMPVELARILILAAAAAGLLGVRPSVTLGKRETLAPTADFNDWLRQPPATRWAVLAHGWAQMPYRAHPSREGKQLIPNALGSECADWKLSRLRELVVRLCTDPRFHPGELGKPELAVSRNLSEVLDMVSWRQPRLFEEDSADSVGAILTEATALGVMAMGAMTSAGTALAATIGRVDSLTTAIEQAGPAATALEPSLAPMVDSVIVQADLTVVVPGPPTAELAEFLDAVAAVESRGVARVLRVTPDSLRHAMAVGWTEATISESFRRWSATDVPQPLQVLISDVARSFDQLRSGSAMAYLRSDDTSLLTQILLDQKLVELGLFRLAPTVLACACDHPTLLAKLTKQGYRPVAESPEGKVLVSEAAPNTVKSLRIESQWHRRPSPRQISRAAAALVKSVGQNSGQPRGRQPSGNATNATRGQSRKKRDQTEELTECLDVADLGVIQSVILDAIAAQQPVQITHVRPSGEIGTDVVLPTALAAGAVQATVPEAPKAGTVPEAPKAGPVPEADPERAAGGSTVMSVPLIRILHVAAAAS